MAATITGGSNLYPQTLPTYVFAGGGWLNASTESQATRTMRFSGSVVVMYAAFDANGTSRALTLRQNSTSTGVAINATDSTAGVFHTTNTIHFAVGDTINLLQTGSGTGYETPFFMMVVSADSGTYSLHGTGYSGGVSTVSYYSLAGAQVGGTTGQGATLIRAPGTASHMILMLQQNSTTANFTCTSRHNGAAGNQTVTATSGVTGIYEDTTHSDTLVNGDSFGFTSPALTGGTIGNMFACQISHTTTASEISTILNGIAYSASTQYQPLCNAAYDWGGTNTTESLVQVPLSVMGSLAHFRCYVLSNSVNGATPFTLRKNGANGANTFSVGSSTTGAFEDSTHTDTYNPGDLANFAYLTGGSSGSMSLGWAAITLTVADYIHGYPVYADPIITKEIVSY
jgi:hypothetical protein